jgi:LacI family transcriptional regulator
MKDVAREAGVALGTVSKVMNGLPVGAEYKARVQRAVAKLNYQVNSYAKGLKMSKTLTIALIIPNIYNTFFSELAHHVNRALSERGYHMLLCTTDDSRDQEQSLIDMMRQNKVDGIIVLSYSTSLSFSSEIPVVSIDRRFGTSIPCVSSDNAGGGMTAAEKLISLGCRKLAYLSLMTDVETEVAKRKDGFLSVCRSRGISCAVSETIGTDNFSSVADFLNGHLRDGRLDFDGLFCVSDSLAYLVRSFLAERGLTVPGDVQIIGFDGIRKFGFLDLFCSTIVQPVEEISRTCVDLILNAGQDRKTVPSLICLPIRYQAGGTTREPV